MVALVILAVLLVIGAGLLGVRWLIKFLTEHQEERMKFLRDQNEYVNRTLVQANAALSTELVRANDRAERNTELVTTSIRDAIEGIVEVIGKNAMGPMPEQDGRQAEDEPVLGGFGLGDEEDWTTNFIDPPAGDRSDVPVLEPGMGIPGITIPDLSGEKA